MNASPAFGQVDLDSCAREPIHLPGSIQPHGILLVVNRDNLDIEQHAGDPRFLLGVEASALAGRCLADFFDATVLDSMLLPLRGVPAVTPRLLLGICSRTGSLPLDATLHVQGERGIIELEAARRCPTKSGDPLNQVISMLAVLQSTDSLSALCDAAASQVRAATDFDRVMIYRFLHDGSGKVVAEARANDLEAFLGLHYPASDIPAQARELYQRNWLRLIPDVHYQPAPLVSARTVIGDEPLDMSHCALRSVSPIHVEYLRNMGVGASMSLSIIVGNELWGLIACHNETPRYVPADLRAACELFARMFSLQLEARIETTAAQRSLVPRRALESLTKDLLKSRDIATDLMAGEVKLRDLIPADGGAVWMEGKLSCWGQTPPVAFMHELLAWLTEQGRPVFETFQLSSEFPAATAHVEVASGLLAVSLSRIPADFVLWFRPEVTRTINWAGDPQKPVTVGPHGARLTPRKSFQAWQAEVRQQAVPWDAIEIETAHGFRLLLLETVLHQMDLVRQERAAAFAHQSMLIAELNHRVKNTLANIQALVLQTEGAADSLKNFAWSLQQRIRAMANAHDLMAESQWQGASLHHLLAKELAPFQPAKSHQLNICGDEVFLAKAAALPFTMVVHELVTNAAKYGALSTATGRIDIDWQQAGAEAPFVFTWKERNGPVVTPPTGRGFGSIIIERSLRHEIQGSSQLRFEPDGVACILSIPATQLVGNRHDEVHHD